MSLKRTPIIALDGPSALTLYRDRAELRHKAKEIELGDEQEETEFYLSDEDIAYFVALEEGTYFPSDEDVAYFLSLDEEPDFSNVEVTKMVAQSIYNPPNLGRESQSDVPELLPLVRSRFHTIGRCATRSQELKTIPFDELGVRPPSSESPLYVLASLDKIRKVKNVHQRSCGQQISAGLLRRLGDNVFVPNPELTFLLLARYASVPELVALGMEMCGHYRMCGAATKDLLQSSKTVYNCEPLTTPKKLHDFVEQATGFYGASRALKACAHIARNSCSPMETALYLLLCLPRTMGGYGLTKPVLNAKQSVSRSASSITFAKNLKPDLFWPEARLDMEYDSDEFHSSPEALEKGARRTIALRLMRVDVLSLTYDVMSDDAAFDSVARDAARILGNRLPKKGTFPNAKSDALRALILPPNDGSEATGIDSRLE